MSVHEAPNLYSVLSVGAHSVPLCFAFQGLLVVMPVGDVESKKTLRIYVYVLENDVIRPIVVMVSMVENNVVVTKVFYK